MKRTEYMIDLYHFGDEAVKEEQAKIVNMLKELLPDAEVNLEPCKIDFALLTVTVETP